MPRPSQNQAEAGRAIIEEHVRMYGATASDTQTRSAAMAVFAAMSGEFSIPSQFHECVRRATSGAINPAAGIMEPVEAEADLDEDWDATDEVEPDEVDDDEPEEEDDLPDRDALMHMTKDAMFKQAKDEGAPTTDTMTKADIADAILANR